MYKGDMFKSFCLCVCMCECVPYVSVRYPKRPEKDITSPETGVTDL